MRKVFGASSEKLDRSQLDYFLLQPETAPGKSEASSALEEADPQRSRHRPSPKEKHLPDHLPVIEEVIRSRGGEGSSATVALHRIGNQRATRLRTGPVPQTKTGAAQVCLAPKSRGCSGHRRVAAEVGRNAPSLRLDCWRRSS
ncbi:MAG: transposase [Verrucomicrobiota bacterium]